MSSLEWCVPFTSECNLLSSDRFAIFPARFPVLSSLDDLSDSAGLVACRFVFRSDDFMGFIGKEIQQDGDHTCLSEVIFVDIFQIRDVFFQLLVSGLHVFERLCNFLPADTIPRPGDILGSLLLASL